MTGRRFAIILAAEADPDPDAAIRRLRAILKALGRSYGIRCLSAEELHEDPDPTVTHSPRSPNHEAPATKLPQADPPRLSGGPDLSKPLPPVAVMTDLEIDDELLSRALARLEDDGDPAAILRREMEAELRAARADDEGTPIDRTPGDPDTD